MGFVRARAHVRALMTRKSCTVGMRNAILRNYLKEKPPKATFMWLLVASTDNIKGLIDYGCHAGRQTTTVTMGWNTNTTRQRESMQCSKSFLAWQLLANFSTTADSLSMFPLNMPLCLFGASRSSLVHLPELVVTATWPATQRLQ